MKDLTAGDVMSSPLVTIEKATPIQEAATTLAEHHISGALVVDYSGRPLGVISLFDIAGRFAGLRRPADEPGGFYRYAYPNFAEGGEGWEKGWDEGEGALDRLPVAEIMSTVIITVPDDMPLSEVAQTLWKRHIHRVFVARDGIPVGVISTMDVLRSLTGGPPRAGPPKLKG